MFYKCFYDSWFKTFNLCVVLILIILISRKTSEFLDLPRSLARLVWRKKKLKALGSCFINY